MLNDDARDPSRASLFTSGDFLRRDAVPDGVSSIGQTGIHSGHSIVLVVSLIRDVGHEPIRRFAAKTDDSPVYSTSVELQIHLIEVEVIPALAVTQGHLRTFLHRTVGQQEGGQ